MTRRPSFQFYPGDWVGNANLRRCSHEEKGAWIETMCLMHDSATEYGILHWPLREIGQAVHCKVAVLQALVTKGVLKGADPGEMCTEFIFTPYHAGKRGEPVTLVPAQPGPVWYSSRMVKDEYIRQVRGKSSRFEEAPGEDPTPSPDPQPNPSPMPPFGDGSSSSSSFSSSSVDPLLRSDQEKNPGQGGEVFLSLPCQKGKQYFVTQSVLDRWKKAFPDIEPMAQARKMKFWLEENSTRQKTYNGMGKFFCNWLGNAQKDVKSPAQHPKRSFSRGKEVDPGWSAQLEELEQKGA